MKPISPIPERLAPPELSAPRGERTRTKFVYHASAWAFMWVPLLIVLLFYVGDAYAALRPFLSPVFAVLGFGSPVLLIFAIAVVLRARSKAKWFFVAMNACALLLILVAIVFAASFRLH